MKKGTIIDSVIKWFKIGMFLYIATRYLISNEPVKTIYAQILWPFLIYAIVNLVRILRPGYIGFLIAGGLLNVGFIYYYGSNHMLFLVLTLLSFLIVEKDNIARRFMFLKKYRDR